MEALDTHTRISRRKKTSEDRVEEFLSKESKGIIKRNTENQEVNVRKDYGRRRETADTGNGILGSAEVSKREGAKRGSEM